jgi:hypothetical protein
MEELEDRDKERTGETERRRERERENERSERRVTMLQDFRCHVNGRLRAGF